MLTSLAFQNCAPQNFSLNGEAAKISALGMTEDGGANNPLATPAIDNPGAPLTTIDEAPAPAIEPAGSSQEASAGNPNPVAPSPISATAEVAAVIIPVSNPLPVEVQNPASAENSSPSATATGLCILEKNGRSLKLGLVDGRLVGVQAVSKAVCVSKSFCLGAVDKVQPVKEWRDSAPCGHNPNLISLDDATAAQAL